MVNLISLLKDRLQGRRVRHLQRRISHYRRELADAQRATRRWKTEYAGQRTLIGELRARVSSLKVQRDRSRSLFTTDLTPFGS